jgi:pentatricopeptide repeat protein
LNRLSLGYVDIRQNNGLFALREHVRPIIAACCRGGKGTTALELFLSMGEDGVQEPSREESNLIITVSVILLAFSLYHH